MVAARSIAIALLYLPLATWALAADPAAEAPPLTGEQLQKLVADLDSDKFATRVQATRQLTAAGKQAIPAVSEAARGKSAEASTRALEVLKDMFHSTEAETREAAKSALETLAKDDNTVLANRAGDIVSPKPDPPPQPMNPFARRFQVGGAGRIQINAGGALPIIAGARAVRMQNVNGVRTIEATENGKKVKILDDPNKGIVVEVTEKVNGQDKTNKYEAKNAAELKKNHPEADKIFQQYAAGNAQQGIQIQIQAIGPGVPAQPPAVPVR